MYVIYEQPLQTACVISVLAAKWYKQTPNFLFQVHDIKCRIELFKFQKQTWYQNLNSRFILDRKIILVLGTEMLSKCSLPMMLTGMAIMHFSQKMLVQTSRKNTFGNGRSTERITYP